MALQAPQNALDICKLAFINIKQDVRELADVTTTPTTDSEILCNKQYELSRLTVLRKHPWNFAIKRIELDTPTTAPVYGFSTAYALPADFVRYLSRSDSLGSELPKEDYAIEDGNILVNSTDDGSIYIRYIYDNTDVTTWDSLVLQVLVLELAIALAPSFHVAESRIRRMVEIEMSVLQQARGIDGQERPPKRIERSRWHAARRRQTVEYAGPYWYFN